MTTTDITYRWIDGPTASDADWTRIDGILATRGWMRLNRRVTRILVAESDGGTLLGFFVFQLVPHTEPLWVAPSARGTDIPQQLADRMREFLVADGARGWMLVADSPVVERMARERGMRRVESPVYIDVAESRSKEAADGRHIQ